MVVNKHGSFYMRSGWGTKIIQAVKEDNMIFSPSNEQAAIDSIGLGRIMIKALRYWSDAMGLTNEVKTQNGIRKEPTQLFKYIDKYDRYFQRMGTMSLLHRNLALNVDEATAWYWLFNEWNSTTITKDEFSDGFHTYLAVNGMKIKKDAVDKEYNCVKNTYIGEKTFDLKTIMDEDTYPFLAPLKVLKTGEKKILLKTHLNSREIPVELLIYCVAMDNGERNFEGNQISIEALMEEKCQVGRYFNIRYSELIDMLLEAENKRYIGLNNNFGNRYIEFIGYDYTSLLDKYSNRIVIVEQLENDMLWKPGIGGKNGSDVVVYISRSHPFYQYIYKELEAGEDALVILDALFLNLSMAEVSINATDRLLVKIFDKLRFSASLQLSRFIEVRLDDPEFD